MSSHQRYRKSDLHHVEDNGQVIYVHDLSGYFTFLNRTGEQILGYSYEEARQMNFRQIVAPENGNQICEQILGGTADAIGTVYEIEVIAKDGRRVPLELSTRVVFRQGQAEIEGIAVPSILGARAASTTPRCLDTGSSFECWEKK